MIELGRYQIFHVGSENRLCPLCPDCLGIDKIRRYTNNMKEKYIYIYPLFKSKQIEDENHFLFQCQEY